MKIPAAWIGTTDVRFAALPCLFFAQGGAQPLPDGFGFSDALWSDYGAGMTHVLVIFLGLILAQALVFFIAGCFAGGGFHNRKHEAPQRTSCSTGTQKG